jgi:hypothetical protein
MRASGDPAGVAGPYAYDGGAWSFPQADDTIQPWTGYAVNNANNGFVVLQVPPLAANRAGKNLALQPDSKDGWTLRLKARGDHGDDSNNYIGVRPDALAQWDRHDMPEPPPPPGGALHLYFPRPHWSRYPGHYTSDFRPQNAAAPHGQVWDLEISGTGEVRLETEGLDDLPPGISARLLAPDGRLATTLLSDRPFHLSLKAGGQTRRLRLVVGQDTYLADQSQGYGSRPTAFVLEPSFPNPFNPETEIAFSLPVRARVRLGIYDLLGRPVALLWDGERPAGYHRLSWGGLDNNGRAVASGIYLYTLETPQGRLTRKMALVR